MKMSSTLLSAACAAALMASTFVSSATAQEAAAPAAPAATTPDAGTPQPSSSTESYDAWSIECTTVQIPAVAADAAKKIAAAPASTSRICEVAQVYKNQKTGNEVARVAFAYDVKNKGKLVGGLRTLVDVSFEKPVQMLDGEKEVMKGTFKRCAGNYCYAVLEIADDKIAGLSKATNLALQFPISDGKLLRIRMSPKGLGNAMSALKSRSK